MRRGCSHVKPDFASFGTTYPLIDKAPDHILPAIMVLPGGLLAGVDQTIDSKEEDDSNRLLYGILTPYLSDCLTTSFYRHPRRTFGCRVYSRRRCVDISSAIYDVPYTSTIYRAGLVCDITDDKQASSR